MKSEHMPHSGHYFGDQRDVWWNFDFIELMAKRWKLSSVCNIIHTLTLTDESERNVINPLFV